jgi:HlyD family secretion protein
VWIVAATAALAGAVGLIVWAGGGEPGGRDAPAMFEVGKRSFELTLTASGDLQARNETVIRSPVETRSAIVELVDEGTMVRAGDTLVVLSTDELEKQLENELLALETARSDLVSAQNDLSIQISDNESDLKKAELRVELAHLEMRKWSEGTDAEKIKQLTFDIEAAERECERMREKLARSKELHSKDFLSSDELKQDQLNSDRWEADLVKANLRLQVYENFERLMEQKKKGSEIEEAEAELERVKRRSDNRRQSREATVTQRQRQLDLRERRVAKLREQIDAATMTAPRDGLVVYASSLRSDRRWNNDPLKVGKEVRHNEELIVIPDNTEMVAQINIHESLVGRVREGMPARVRIDAKRGRSYEGEVLSVGVIAETGGWRDPNLREYTVDILLTLDEMHGLKPSMRCEAELILGTVDDALAAPPQAVFYDQGSAFVYRSAGDARYERVGVNVGRRSDMFVEIASGLDEGDRVLLRKPTPGEIVGGRKAAADEPEVAKKRGGGPTRPKAAGVG